MEGKVENPWFVTKKIIRFGAEPNFQKPPVTCHAARDLRAASKNLKKKMRFLVVWMTFFPKKTIKQRVLLEKLEVSQSECFG